MAYLQGTVKGIRTMRILSTPASRFTGLQDYRFNSHFVKIDYIKMHYIDEGLADAGIVLLLHGVPSWSYLYRHMIKIIAATGSRVIAPDLIGFGRSDKPVKVKHHTYQSHVEWITEFIKILNLKDIVLFCHDWGSLIGLRIAACSPDLFKGIIVSNGMLPDGEQKLHPKFKLWKFFARYSPFIPVDLVIESGTLRKLTKEEKEAYRAPFPSSKYKSGIRALPGLVPSSPDDPESVVNRIAWESLKKFNKPFLTVFSKKDPITRGGGEYMQKRIPGAIGKDHTLLDAGHFIQEDRHKELSDIIIRFIENQI
jgi:haloalkane dehalogenase